MSQPRPIAPEKMARLSAFLGSLPPSASVKLFATLEADRARGGADLPHAEMLTVLRRRVFEHKAAMPPRYLSASRLFFRPIEDFLVADRTGRKRRARIARESLGPIWALIEADPACASVARAASRLTDSLVARQVAATIPPEVADEINGLVDSLYNAAGQVFSRMTARAETDPAFRADLARRLGGAPAYHDLIEINMLLTGAAHLRNLRGMFPKPVAALSEDDLYKVRAIYAEACTEAPDAAPYILLALAARMAEPWSAMALYYHFARLKDEALAYAESDAKALLESLFEDIEAAARGLERDAAGAFEATSAGLKFIHFADFADGMEKAARRARDGVVLNRIAACRDVAAEALERFAEQSVSALRRAMPVRRASGSSRLMALRPDVARTLSPSLAREAGEAALFLSRLEAMSRRVNREASVSLHLKEATANARRYANDLVTEIRAAEGEDRAAARRLMEHVLKVMAPLFAADEIGLIRDRAGAAAVSA